MATNLPNSDIALSDTASQPDDQPIAIPKTSASSQPSNDLKLNDYTQQHQISSQESETAGKAAKAGMDARTKISSLLKDKEQEWTAVAEKKGPLRLLHLPMDVLKEIVKEVTHTNDLTALALTHSALHNLAIPHIYSRFDIVWPDAHATTDPRTGVDALTYGLATLCMGDVIANNGGEQSFTCTNCGAVNNTECNHDLRPNPGNGQRRMGNQYPQFTRKFSLGNGPADWVQEYLITKESGKMLGTLVALAVKRMVNLEAFVWDMPTGVLRDVWLALSSLQSRHPGRECRLERVWVRWHDNSDPVNSAAGQTSPAASSTTPQMLAGSTMTSIGWTVPSGTNLNPPGHSYPRSYAQSHVEYPTLSVLPPLKSLSVLDIDELDYLDEMSMLIAKSKDCLRELRVGISAKAVNRDFVLAWDGPELQQVDHKAPWPGASTIGERRLGGVLGALVGRIFDIRKKQRAIRPEKKDWGVSAASSTPVPADAPHVETQVPFPTGPQTDEGLGNPLLDTSQSSSLEEYWEAKETPAAGEETAPTPGVAFNIDGGASLIHSNELHDTTPSDLVTAPLQLDHAQSDMDSLNALISAHGSASTAHTHYGAVLPGATTDLPLRRSQPQYRKQSHFSEIPPSERTRLEGKLRLQTLELERVPLSVVVLQKAFDWTVLTNLTILDCPQHDRLWVMLRRHFQPSPTGPSQSTKQGSTMALQYHLNLRKIHTDAASTSLIAFLKDTLAPNTLETLFLQDRRRSSNTNVTIDAIYRGPLKRHRASLKKLMLDSSDKIPRGPSSSDGSRYRTWMPNRDVLNFITSGRMSSLRELSIAVDYKDWHHFLQRLPNVPHLRSLNIPFIADHVTAAFDPRELALQVVDVIVLRPEVELCYMGVSHKCFEILENRPQDEAHGSPDNHSSAISAGHGGVTIDEDDDDEDEEGSDDEDEDEEDDNGTAIAPVDPDETESEISDHSDSDSDSYDESEDGLSKVRLRLREILFYDDKVAIFKARHGKL
ncbi:Uncharacterized protein BP5553_06097 [Venustampulla echinocandica]|uniref:F-box domain-containing protein n=1 Tax=Venustampulla echinocandica TaxID=2656787 RepID=A0A370TMK2_9HELO|nr:Uncharacterized protein BP5553_06097 [Venustampulla echinocandica]RDL36745.1 Uncharacterized protein BP5553_06097 [Venustampulla echinocandica]